MRGRPPERRRDYGAGLARSLTWESPYVSAVAAVTTKEFVSFAAE